MLLRIEILKEKKLIGNCIKMSFSNNRTSELWRNFMPRRKEITNAIGTELYSAEVYEPGFFDTFDATKEFYKWAAIEVKDIDIVPEGMDTILFPTGLYAVFLHKGPASDGPKTSNYIFRTWLPASDYKLDSRPHFAVMGEKYRHEDANSEEEIWIPIVKK